LILMMPAKQPDDPPGKSESAPPDPMAGMLPELAGLRVTNLAMAGVIAQQAAQLNELLGADEYLALLACDRGGYSDEALRAWCISGKVDAYQDDTSHWFVNQRSLRAHLAKLGLAKAIRRVRA
jgi:hypothetical protein